MWFFKKMGAYIVMIFYKSHADQWNHNQINFAIHNGCSIIEIDLIYLRGEILLSHSWRPFKWMTYGPAEKYFEFCKNYKGQEPIYLMIDIKTTNRKIIPRLQAWFSYYGNGKVNFLIIFDEKNKKRKAISEAIYYGSHGKRSDDWADGIREMGHEIITKNLYEAELWYKKLNHF